MNANEIVTAALQLSEDERLRVLEQLFDSLEPGDELSDEEWGAAWGPEIEARIEEAESDVAALVPAETVFAELRKKYGSTK